MPVILADIDVKWIRQRGFGKGQGVGVGGGVIGTLTLFKTNSVHFVTPFLKDIKGQFS